MKLENIYNILNAEIPHALSDRYVAAYGGHDNSGILLNTGEEIERAVGGENHGFHIGIFSH